MLKKIKGAFCLRQRSQNAPNSIFNLVIILLISTSNKFPRKNEHT